jgi:hypothetical protein
MDYPLPLPSPHPNLYFWGVNTSKKGMEEQQLGQGAMGREGEGV